MIKWENENNHISKIEYKDLDVGETFILEEKPNIVFIKTNNFCVPINQNKTAYKPGLEIDVYEFEKVLPVELIISLV